MIPNSEITDRPWRGKCATSGWTVEQFEQAFEFEAQSGGEFPRWAKRAAVSICRSYGIKGLCDPAYIANVVLNAERGWTPDS